MTREQLEEIKKLLAVFWDGSTPYNPKLGVEIADRALPLVKALEEALMERDEARAEVEQLTKARDYDAKVIPDLMRELEEAKLLLSVKMETVESMRQTVAETRAEVERLRSVLRLLWEEATDEGRCQYEYAPGCYGHHISKPCREVIKAVLKGDE